MGDVALEPTGSSTPVVLWGHGRFPTRLAFTRYRAVEYVHAIATGPVFICSARGTPARRISEFVRYGWKGGIYFEAAGLLLVLSAGAGTARAQDRERHSRLC
jgi:hypothetical protein